MTTFESKCEILADLWLNYRYDPEFTEFVSYNDLGLPLAYALDTDVVKETELARQFVEETFAMLLTLANVEDEGFETLDGLMTADQIEEE